eukprot:359109-Chlamydomonas_euryale.AAC.4
MLATDALVLIQFKKQLVQGFLHVVRSPLSHDLTHGRGASKASSYAPPRRQDCAVPMLHAVTRSACFML